MNNKYMPDTIFAGIYHDQETPNEWRTTKMTGSVEYIRADIAPAPKAGEMPEWFNKQTVWEAHNGIMPEETPTPPNAALEVDAIQTIIDQYFEEVLKNKSYNGRTSRGATWAKANDQLNAVRALRNTEITVG